MTDRARRWSTPGDPRAGEPPARGLQVGVEPGQHGERAAGHRRLRPTAGDLGQVREVGELAEDEAQGLVVRRAGHRPDPEHVRHQAPRPASAADRAVALIVHEPTTRDPS